MQICTTNENYSLFLIRFIRSYTRSAIYNSDKGTLCLTFRILEMEFLNVKFFIHNLCCFCCVIY